MIRLAEEKDLNRIEEIYERILVKQDQGQAPIGWIRGVYPTRKTAEDALRERELFVLEKEGTIVAAAKINQKQEAAYEKAAWRQANAPDSQVMVLHTLTVDPAFWGKGYGSEFVKAYESYALKHNCPYLRMDTNEINSAARRLYRRLGYEESGIVPCVFNGIPDVGLVCLEKTLSREHIRTCPAREFMLREWQTEDAEAIASAADNEKIAANLRNLFPHPYTLEDARQYVKGCMDRKEEGQITRAIVVDGRAVGSIGIFLMNDVYEKSGELGYWLAEEFWGQGIMTRAVTQLCREAFTKFDIIRIFAEPFAHNTGSRRVLEKAGFTCEGMMRKGIFKNGNVDSYCMYSLLREEITPA